YTSIQALQEGEPLLRVKPFEKTLNESRYIFFIPKIRSFDGEVRVEINSKLRELAKYLPKGSVLINNLPVGMGGNLENIRLIERVSGFKWNEDFDYVYCPFVPCTKNPITVGSDKLKMDKGLLEVFQLAGIKTPPLLPLRLSEAAHARQVISHLADMVANFELLKKAKEGVERLEKIKSFGHREVYLNDLIEYTFDLKVFTNTFISGEPLLYLSTGILRSINSYTKYLIDELRKFIKARELKTSKMKIVLLWSLDQFEARGDRLMTLKSMVERFKDYISDTIPISRKDEWANLIQPTDRTYIIITCSKQDFEATLKMVKDKTLPGGFILKANMPIEWMTG
ncbi:MAG: hypothetical protein N3F06_02840, partial [Nitrososphaerales archaeon]|nr:hypothetical protein [Nitrososphaerales archaeon]